MVVNKKDINSTGIEILWQRVLLTCLTKPINIHSITNKQTRKKTNVSNNIFYQYTVWCNTSESGLKSKHEYHL